MTVTHRITNKETRLVIEGELTAFHGEYFDFHIAGCRTENGFGSADWDIEEIEPPYTLPTEDGLYGIDNSAGDPFGRRVFKNSLDGWLELTSPDLTPREVVATLLVNKWPLRRLGFAPKEES